MEIISMPFLMQKKDSHKLSFKFVLKDIYYLDAIVSENI